MRAIVVALAFAAACGYKPETAPPWPAVAVESLLSRDWSGDRMLFDKNENLIQTAAVDWRCSRQNPYEADCQETITYLHAGRPSNPPPGDYKEHGTYHWRFQYQDRGPVQVELKTGELVQKGQVRGSLVYLKGDGLIPRSNVACVRETRIFAADDVEKRLVQVDVYSRHGVELGRAVTAWRRIDR